MNLSSRSDVNDLGLAHVERFDGVVGDLRPYGEDFVPRKALGQFPNRQTGRVGPYSEVADRIMHDVLAGKLIRRRPIAHSVPGMNTVR
jgi:hypothetical protein